MPTRVDAERSHMGIPATARALIDLAATRNRALVRSQRISGRRYLGTEAPARYGRARLAILSVLLSRPLWVPELLLCQFQVDAAGAQHSAFGKRGPSVRDFKRPPL